MHQLNPLRDRLIFRTSWRALRRMWLRTHNEHRRVKAAVARYIGSRNGGYTTFHPPQVDVSEHSHIVEHSRRTEPMSSHRNIRSAMEIAMRGRSCMPPH